MPAHQKLETLQFQNEDYVARFFSHLPKDAARANFQIAGAGYALHWADLDEDIGVEGLMLGKRSTERIINVTVTDDTLSVDLE